MFKDERIQIAIIITRWERHVIHYYDVSTRFTKLFLLKYKQFRRLDETPLAEELFKIELGETETNAKA